MFAEPQRYQKIPVDVTALEWTGKNHADMEKFLNRENFYYDFSRIKGGLIIKTLEGEHAASIGDFIICDVAGEYYPCKPDIFKKTYTRMEDPSYCNTFLKGVPKKEENNG